MNRNRALKSLLVSLSILSLCALAHSGPSFKAGKSVARFEVDGVGRAYNVRLPSAVESSGRKLPLVLLLHGFSGNATSIEGYSGFGALADKEGFILVTPEGLGSPAGWNCGFVNLGRQGIDDSKFLSELLNKVTKDYPVDPKRVFIAGHSNGAMMANVLGGLRTDKVAAIACMAGVIGVGRTEKRTMPDPKGRLSVLHIHGKDDRVVAYDEQSNALLGGVSAPDAVRWWADKIGIKSSPTKSSFAKYQSVTYSDSKSTVELISIPGWGHDWPTGPKSPFEAAQVIWEFFKAHPKS